MGRVLMRAGGTSSDFDATNVDEYDVRAGRFFIDRTGELKEGKMENAGTGNSGKTTINSNTNSRILIFNSMAMSDDKSYTYFSPNLSNGYISDTTYLSIESSKLGDANESHVLEGKTFTSKSGVKISGTCTNNGDHTSLNSYRAVEDGIEIQIPQGMYFNTESNKDPYVTIPKAKLAEILTTYFGVNIVENFKVAQLYSRKFTVSWELSSSKIWAQGKEFNRTAERKGMCTGVRILYKKDSEPGTPDNPGEGTFVVDAINKGKIGSFTSDTLDVGTWYIKVFSYGSLTDSNSRVYSLSTANVSKSISISELNGSFALPVSTINFNTPAQMFTVPANVKYIGYVLVGNGGSALGPDIEEYDDRNGRTKTIITPSGGGGGGYITEGVLKVTPGEQILCALPYNKYNGKYVDENCTKIIVGNNRVVLTAANGGTGWGTYGQGVYGGNGSSGGGGGNGIGGSDGSNGGGTHPGTGQHSTTRSKLTKVLYGGGGGSGGTGYSYSVGAGGAGGGGGGWDYHGNGGPAPTPGLGGGSGGSGERYFHAPSILGGMGCLFFAWGDVVMDTYKDEILRMEREG